MITTPDFLKEKVSQSPVLQSALCHVSCRDIAVKSLALSNSDPALYDLWSSVGKASIGLYAARLMLGSVGCTNAGEASRGQQGFIRIIHNTLSALIRDNELAQFGDTMKAPERQIPSVFSELTTQLVGCWTHLNGFSSTRIELFRPIFERIAVTLPSAKDSKTLLQEILQARKLRPPVYQLVEVAGSQHTQSFSMKVFAFENRSSVGHGRSKKEAELDAAKNFLAIHFPRIASPPGLSLRPNFDVQTAAHLLKYVPQSKEIDLFARELQLPSWAYGLLALAFVHRSRKLTNESSVFGNDNSLLAFLGSNVIQWATQGIILQRLSPTEIVHRGGLAPILSQIISEKGISAIADTLHSRELRLFVGLGQDSVHKIPASSVEMLQAVIGVIFLVREFEIHSATDIFSNAKFILSSIEQLLSSVSDDRDSIWPSKTLLQERCQAMRIGISYHFKVANEGSTSVVTPSLRLSSLRNVGALEISLQTETVPTHLTRKRADLESQLATVVLQFLDKTIGRENLTAIISPDTSPVSKWLLFHLLKELENSQSEVNQSYIARIAALDVFGLKALKSENFLEFKSWYTFAVTTLCVESLPIEPLRRIFAVAGGGKLQTGYRRLIDQLPRIETFIQSLDPLLNASELQKTVEYNELVGTAAAFRLLGAELSETSLDDVLSQAALLCRPSKFTIEENIRLWRCLEIRGSTLLLLDTLVSSKTSVDGNLEVSVQGTGDRLIVNIKKQTGAGQELKNKLESSPLWAILKTLVPILSVDENQQRLSVEIYHCNDSPTDVGMMKAWWSYHLHSSLKAVTNDTISSLLHDLKNELLAYSTAAQLASVATSQTLKYKIASDASKHCDEAITKVTVLKTLLHSSGSVENASVQVSMFFRSLMGEILTWLPASVSLSMPFEATNDEMWTDQGKLRSILTNLVRNSVKAMDDKGQLSISYVYDAVTKALEVEVGDCGPGLTREQIDTLENGKGLPSSSRHGAGIGLLTVLLLTSELSGSVRFQNRQSGGLVVNISIPSLIDDTTDDFEARLITEICESVEIDEYSLGR